jgi:S-adenosylmethionine decarboxylase
MENDVFPMVRREAQTARADLERERTILRSAASDTNSRAHLAPESIRHAGARLLIDLYGASRLDDIGAIEECLRHCANAADATLLHLHLRPFEANGGVSGIAVLAESHLSIHTWPEHGYAAVDIFMCGLAQPARCVEVLRSAFAPSRLVVEEILRGRLR